MGEITPMPVPNFARAALLFGGVFDPPHRAHVELASRARDRVMGPECWLVWVPAARSPLKAASPIASDADRVEMLRRATAGLERSAIWTDELDRGVGGPSYWIDTLARAREVLAPGVDLRFLIGADQAADFHRWRDPRGVLALASPVVMPRAPLLTPEALAQATAGQAWSPEEVASWRSWMAPVEPIPASSTDTRSAAHGGRKALAGLVPPEVLDYIRERGLYR